MNERIPKLMAVALLAGLLGACRQDMHDQPRLEPLERSTFFADGRASRPQVEGTVAQGQLRSDTVLFTGKSGDDLADTLPFPVTRVGLERGRKQFEIFCAPCHGRLGDGQGMIVRRGFRAPPTYHSDHLREMPAGHFFDVITNGFGAMGDFQDRITPRDRWLIVTYIRALQLSQQAKLTELPDNVRQRFEQAVAP